MVVFYLYETQTGCVAMFTFFFLQVKATTNVVRWQHWQIHVGGTRWKLQQIIMEKWIFVN